MQTPSRLLLAAAGLCGASGVAAAAYASHGGYANLTIAAQFLLVHAAALLALSLLPARRSLRAAALVLLVGLVLFAGDLALRDLAARPLFPFAAPLGGGALIVGWLLLAVAALLPQRRD